MYAFSLITFLSFLTAVYADSSFSQELDDKTRALLIACVSVCVILFILSCLLICLAISMCGANKKIKNLVDNLSDNEKANIANVEKQMGEALNGEQL